MAEAMILEFDGFGTDTYRRVNDELGLDMETGEGDWPEGLISHIGAASDGGFVVFEVWRSKPDQERFLAERLVAALRAAGVPPQPTRAEWLELAAHHEHPEQA